MPRPATSISPARQLFQATAAADAPAADPPPGDAPAARVPEVGDVVHLYAIRWHGMEPVPISVAAAVTHVHSPGDPDSVLDVETEWEETHSDVSPINRRAWGADNARLGRWAFVDALGVIHDPPDRLPAVGDSDLVVFLRRYGVEPVPARVAAVVDPEHLRLDLVVKDRERHPNVLPARGSPGDDTWGWVPAELLPSKHS